MFSPVSILPLQQKHHPEQEAEEGLAIVVALVDSQPHSISTTAGGDDGHLAQPEDHVVVQLLVLGPPAIASVVGLI